MQEQHDLLLLDQNQLVISLSKVLDKLFANENFDRQTHIQYISDLLLLHPTANCLNGLQLDHIDFDFKLQQVMIKPATIPSSRKIKVDDLSTTLYINSVAQLDELDVKAIIWNTLIIKAAVYLIALPEIRPELFAKSFTEHFNTVKRIFNRFRTANKILNHARNHQNAEEYRLLWDQYLPSPKLTLGEFVDYLDNLIKQEQLNQFTKNLLNDIRITFHYVLESKAKIARESKDHNLPVQYLDEEHLIQEIFDAPDGGPKAKPSTIEKQVDEPNLRQIDVDPSHYTPIAAYSESSQNYVLPLVAKHIQRSEHLFTSSGLYPNPSSIRALLNALYQDYCKQEPDSKVSLILMLAFLTGNKVQEWMRCQSKRVENLNARQKLCLLNDQYFLQSRFSIFEQKDFHSPHALLNQTVSLEIPIPNQFVEALRHGEKIIEEDLQQKLRQLRKELYIPKLSLVKLSSLLHHTILEQTGNKQLADIITGIDANQSSSISYCHHNVQFLQQKYLLTINELCQSLSNEYQGIKLTDISSNFGSQKAPNGSVIVNIFSILHYQILIQAEDDWLAKFKHYSVWMWHFLLLFTAARPVSEFPGFLKSFNINRKIMIISDKEIGGRQGNGRIIPLSDFVLDELDKYLEFIKNFKKYIRVSHPQIAVNIQEIFDSKIPLLHTIEHDQLIPLTPSLVNNIHPQLALDYPNWHRHTARAFLTHKIDEHEILALFGHEPMQQEAAHQYSSLAFSQYAKVANTLGQMKDAFKITGINLNAII